MPRVCCDFCQTLSLPPHSAGVRFGGGLSVCVWLSMPQVSLSELMSAAGVTAAEAGADAAAASSRLCLCV